jgi:hypothetical protein
MLLASVIIGVITVSGLQQLAEYQMEIRATAVAESQVSFQQLASQYYFAHETAMRTAMSAGTDATNQCRLGVTPAAPDPSTTGIVVNDTTKRTCAIDMAFLKWKGLAPTSMNETNAYQQKWVAIFRLGAPLASGEEPGVEMLTLGVGQVTGIMDYAPNAWFETDTDRLIKAARKMGAMGGYVPYGDVGVCAYEPSISKFEACSVQGGWKVDVSGFVD